MYSQFLAPAKILEISVGFLSVCWSQLISGQMGSLRNATFSVADGYVKHKGRDREEKQSAGPL